MIRPPSAGDSTTVGIGRAQPFRQRTPERLGVDGMLQDERGLQIARTVKPGGQPEMPLEQGARLAVQRKHASEFIVQEHSLKP